MGKFTEFKLPLKSMPIGVQNFEYQLGKQFFVNMENNEVRNSDIKVDLRVEHKNDFYDLNFAIKGEVIVGCDRCLDDLALPIDTTYHIMVKYGDDYRDDSDDFMEIPESDNYLNVAYMIYDTVVLAIPLKHVHPLGKCNRSMTALLKKHRSTSADPDEASLEDDLIDEMDQMEPEADNEVPTDSRWDKLKDLDLN